MDTTFEKLMAYARTVGVPAATLSTCCDILAPQGGGLVLIALGLLTMVLLLAWARYRERSTVYRVTLGTAWHGWLWDGPRKHGAYMLALFVTFCFVFGSYSYAKRDEGGAWASSFESLQVMQAQLDVARETLDVQRESLGAQREIAGTVATLKREVSSNPAKELANLGFEMSPTGLSNAIQLGRADAVGLFAAANVKLPEPTFSVDDIPAEHASTAVSNLARFPGLLGVVYPVVRSGDASLAQAVAELGTADSAEQCLLSEGGIAVLAPELETADRRDAWLTMCAGETMRSRARALVDARRAAAAGSPQRRELCSRELRSLIGKPFDISETASGADTSAAGLFRSKAARSGAVGVNPQGQYVLTPNAAGLIDDVCADESAGRFVATDRQLEIVLALLESNPQKPGAAR